MSSTPRKLIFAEKARCKLQKGVEKFTDAIALDFGPKGKKGGSKKIDLKDPHMKMGVLMAKETARRIKERSGGGVAMGMILLRSLVKEGLKKIASGVNPERLKQEVEKGVQKLLCTMDHLSMPVEESRSIERIAMNLCQDKEVAHLISKAFEWVGKSGVITVEESEGSTSDVEMVKGVQLGFGYLSPYFCTNSEKMLFEGKKVALLITDRKILAIQEILPLLQAVSYRETSLLIIAKEIDKDILSTLILSKLHKSVKVVAIEVPSLDKQGKGLLEEIATLTGASIVCKKKGMRLKDAGIEVLGQIERLKIDKHSTMIIDNRSRKKDEKERVDKCKVAIIHVGALTKSEMHQKKQTVEKSLNTLYAVQEKGFVPGGGIAFLRACQMVDPTTLFSDEKMGFEVVFKACMAPFKQLVENCGKDSSIYLEEVLPQEKSVGFNVLTERVEDLVKSSIIDPTKTVKNALTLATSTAGMIFLSEVLIADTTEKEEKFR